MIYEYKILEKNGKEFDGVLNINFANVSFIKIEDLPNNLFKIYFRHKTTYNEFTFKIKLKESDLNAFFLQHSIYRLEDYLINISKLSYVIEKEISKKEVEITFYFFDGSVCKIKTIKSRWKFWKQNKLK